MPPTPDPRAIVDVSGLREAGGQQSARGGHHRGVECGEDPTDRQAGVIGLGDGRVVPVVSPRDDLVRHRAGV